MRLRAADTAWADTVLLGRFDNWYERKLAERLRAAGKRLVYVIDDDLMNIPPQISSASYYSQPEIQDNIRACVDMSHAILTPSPLLAEKYGGNGRIAIRTEEPALDPVPYRPREAGGPVRIGFAGSIDRTADIEAILRDALIRVKHRYGDRVAFEFFGAVPAFAGELGATGIPYTDSYDEYRRVLNARAWDIGLAPMPETPFHACKHYNKFCEYSAAGIAGIYTEAPPYTFIPDRERFGRFCANTPEAWYDQICAEVDDAGTREAHRREGCAYAMTALTPEAIGRALFEAHPEVFVATDVQKGTVRRLTLLKAGNVIDQVREKGGRHGWKLPLVAFKKLLSRLRGGWH